MRQWVNLAVLRGISINPAQARKRILPIDVHRTGPAYTLPARPSERQRRVNLVLDLDQRIQHHWPRLVQVDSVRLQRGLLARFVWVPPVYLELLVHHRLLQRCRLQRHRRRRE